MTQRTNRLFVFTILACFVTILASCATMTTWPSHPGGGTDGPATSKLPFSITISSVSIDNMPDLHSFVYGYRNGKLLLFAGRTNGLHGFPGTPDQKPGAFPKEEANRTIYVVDLDARKVLGHASIDSVAPVYADSLSVTNAQFLLDGNHLIVVGGYGFDSKSNGLITFDTLTVIDFDDMVEAVTSSSRLPERAIEQMSGRGDRFNSAFKVTGGELEELGDAYHLVFGQLFDGTYTVNAGDTGKVFTQVYSEQDRVISIDFSSFPAENSVSVKRLPANPPYDPERPYHRRDLNVAPAVSLSGQLQIGAYGGVFKPGEFAGYVNPIYIEGSGASGFQVTIDTDAVQLLSQYACAVLPMSGNAGTMYTTFFGGISQYYWKDGGLHRDKVDLPNAIDSLPFINSVSTLVRDTNGTTQYLWPKLTFPLSNAATVCGDSNPPVIYLGTETRFLVGNSSIVPQYANGVIMLDKLNKATDVGFLYGGIASNVPYVGEAPPVGKSVTCASNLVYKVTVAPVATPVIPLEMP